MSAILNITRNSHCNPHPNCHLYKSRHIYLHIWAYQYAHDTDFINMNIDLQTRIPGTDWCQNNFRYGHRAKIYVLIYFF